ncbi:TetR/AcrR family transcriptional regulator [Flavobacterium sp. FlaQc-48]|uniref:TetR/AcrR family transcriptional regulator n=1 Tax=Flavobacterium sp. FlaQc-48 TaxID=3374181 RepID=UPI00375780D5
MREQIIAAAKRMFFTERKLHDTMQDIADEIGVTRPVVNYYFRTKDVLMEKFYKETIECLTVRLNFLLDTDSSFYNNISNFIEDSWQANLLKSCIKWFKICRLAVTLKNIKSFDLMFFYTFFVLFNPYSSNNYLGKNNKNDYSYSLYSLFTLRYILFFVKIIQVTNSKNSNF